ncbi:hypothetical protein [Mucilaginibacter lappiensis]|uniref:hypothetical protein n=1 Tax=Mucilaginibacter lappiensis TaxID=354630 RepID=UPI003D2099E3
MKYLTVLLLLTFVFVNDIFSQGIEKISIELNSMMPDGDGSLKINSTEEIGYIQRIEAINTLKYVEPDNFYFSVKPLLKLSQFGTAKIRENAISVLKNAKPSEKDITEGVNVLSATHDHGLESNALSYLLIMNWNMNNKEYFGLFSNSTRHKLLGKLKLISSENRPQPDYSWAPNTGRRANDPIPPEEATMPTLLNILNKLGISVPNYDYHYILLEIFVTQEVFMKGETEFTKFTILKFIAEQFIAHENSGDLQLRYLFNTFKFSDSDLNEIVNTIDKNNTSYDGLFERIIIQLLTRTNATSFNSSTHLNITQIFADNVSVWQTITLNNELKDKLSRTLYALLYNVMVLEPSKPCVRPFISYIEYFAEAQYIAAFCRHIFFNKSKGLSTFFRSRTLCYPRAPEYGLFMLNLANDLEKLPN